MEALQRGDVLHEEAKAVGDAGDQDDGGRDSVDGLEDLYVEAMTPVYPGSTTSVVSATIIIMNMCTVFGVSNKFSDELFRFLAVDLLPPRKKLPGIYYAARKSIRRLGLNYNNVHACPNGCILYKDEYGALNSCPQCTKA